MIVIFPEKSKFSIFSARKKGEHISKSTGRKVFLRLKFGENCRQRSTYLWESGRIHDASLGDTAERSCKRVFLSNFLFGFFSFSMSFDSEGFQSYWVGGCVVLCGSFSYLTTNCQLVAVCLCCHGWKVF